MLKHPSKNSPLSVSALGEAFDRDRGTVRRRLRGIKPAFVAGNLRSYRLTDKNGDGLSVKQLLEADDQDPKLTEARIRKTLAEAGRAELKLELEQGELLPAAEVRNYAYNLMKAIYERIARRYPREAAKRLRKYRSAPDLQHALETDLSLIFDDLKRSVPIFFNEKGKIISVNGN